MNRYGALGAKPAPDQLGKIEVIGTSVGEAPNYPMLLHRVSSAFDQDQVLPDHQSSLESGRGPIREDQIPTAMPPPFGQNQHSHV